MESGRQIRMINLFVYTEFDVLAKQSVGFIQQAIIFKKE